MTHAMTVRLDDETFAQLKELEASASSRSAAVIAAIRTSWERLQEERLTAAYDAAVAETPSYPYESEGERVAARARRDRRQAPA